MVMWAHEVVLHRVASMAISVAKMSTVLFLFLVDAAFLVSLWGAVSTCAKGGGGLRVQYITFLFNCS